MKFFCALFLTLALASGHTYAEAQSGAKHTASNNPVVILHTSKGPITIELYPDKAPVSVENFLNYAQSGFYNGTIFHRVIKRFMIQAGGFDKNMQQKPTNPPIVNESGNGLYNDRYTVAMARTSDPDSATSQFFINTAMNGRLDGIGDQPGYAVFGKVIEGQYVVKAIEKVRTHRVAGHADVPMEPVVIERVEVKDSSKPVKAPTAPTLKSE